MVRLEAIAGCLRVNRPRRSRSAGWSMVATARGIDEMICSDGLPASRSDYSSCSWSTVRMRRAVGVACGLPSSSSTTMRDVASVSPTTRTR